MEFLDINNKEQVAQYEAFIQACPKGNFSQSVLWAKVKTDWDFEAVIVRDNDGNIEGTMGILVRIQSGDDVFAQRSCMRRTQQRGYQEVV